jgi:U3 small nucleolar RNA-associated protein 10
LLQQLICFSLAQEGIDETFIKEAILTRLGDDNVDVVLATLSAFEVSKRFVGVHVLFVNAFLFLLHGP